MLPVDGNAIYDRLIDLAPQLINQFQGILERRAANKVNRRDNNRNPC
jgi:uncharacterized spore protein YtfJ